MRTSDWRLFVYLAAGIGLIISIYAAAETLNPALQSLCSVNGFISCAKVATSGRTTTFGVPDWLIGVLGFVALLAAAAWAEQRRDLFATTPLFVLAVGAVAFSAYFAYVELALVGALCLVCFAAYGAGVLTFVGATVLFGRAYRRAHRPPGPKGRTAAPENSGDGAVARPTRPG